jgi:ribosome-associated protein
MIRVTPRIAVDESEIAESYLRAGGPGGQNVNKVASAVQLRFDAGHSASLDDELRARLKRVAGRRITADGVIVITARRFRTQERNRQDAYQRLIALIRQAAIPAKLRRPTRPTDASVARQRQAKAARSRVKRLRQAVGRETQ